MALKFKKALISDLGIILEIEKSASGSKLYSPILDEKEAKDYLKSSKIFLIYLEDIPIGSISYEVKDKDHAYIDGLVIKPEYQGKGFGTEAIEWILKLLEGYQKISLVTHPENSNAIKIYEKYGFKKTHVIENYFGDDQPRVELVKE